MIYKVFKIIAVLSLMIHTAILFLSVTDFFNWIFMGISLLVIIMPQKWWGLYILPMILLVAGMIPGGYMIYMKFIAG